MSRRNIRESNIYIPTNWISAAAIEARRLRTGSAACLALRDMLRDMLRRIFSQRPDWKVMVHLPFQPKWCASACDWDLSHIPQKFRKFPLKAWCCCCWWWVAPHYAAAAIPLHYIPADAKGWFPGLVVALMKREWGITKCHVGEGIVRIFPGNPENQISDLKYFELPLLRCEAACFCF